MNNRYFILGSGGHAKVIIDAIKKSNKDSEIFLLDDTKEINTDIMGCKILGKISTIDNIVNEYKNGIHFILAIGNNSLRKKISLMIDESIPNFPWVSVIHPTSVISANSIIGEGSYIGPHACIGPGSIIGKHSIINTNATVDHDCQIGSFSHVAPGSTICGTVKVGDLIGGSIDREIDHITLGDDVIIGSGSNVIRNVDSNQKVYGNPGRVIGGVIGKVGGEIDRVIEGQ